MTAQGRRIGRAAVAAGVVAATGLGVAGCGALLPGGHRRLPPPPMPSGYSASPSPYDSYSPSYSYSPSPTPEETYDPDGRTDARGNNCRYDTSARRLEYSVSVTNPSLTKTFKYEMAVNWMRDRPADGTALGLHQRSIIVRPGQTETYTATYYYTNTSTQQMWYTCEIRRARKSEL
ncbi:hypothetical protein ADK76_30755 [Streptomyces griseoflavus]|uniref:hypothetical protein n=1 Tax=Streptomyces rimosus TaxID=1927 RepID=UPI0004C5E8DD|nr:hypothetical protein [Streptomyces rimosus]KOG52818.1 hypothetical protein ADK76_30755 [Streptomyces griseoflavus]